jgi:erythromycin esterase-like protein
MADDRELLAEIHEIAHPLETVVDLDPLIDMIGDARYVLLGEASHGTSEYYLWRAQLTQRLIREKNFSFIAVEGDWPDCYRVNRYIKGYEEAGDSAQSVLFAFERWPTWMWANWEIAALCEWLREYNRRAPANVGFYGLDVYSLWESMEAIIRYLERTAPNSVALAKEAYHCFEPFGESEEAYAWSTRMIPETCEDEVIALLRELRGRTSRFDGDEEAALSAEQNARVVADAERYYRTMVRSDAESWNIRDFHMADTLDRLMEHYQPQAKAIVWAHNTHIGDARATDMIRAGMANLGEIVRQRHDDAGVILVGFSSHRGSVIASDAWGAPMQEMPVPEGRAGSWEDLLHRSGGKNSLLLLKNDGNEAFHQSRGHRAIGVVYRPEHEAFGNYVPTDLPVRYDALLYLEQTTALHPLHITPQAGKEPPATYPWGL